MITPEFQTEVNDMLRVRMALECQRAGEIAGSVTDYFDNASLTDDDVTQFNLRNALGRAQVFYGDVRSGDPISNRHPLPFHFVLTEVLNGMSRGTPQRRFAATASFINTVVMPVCGFDLSDAQDAAQLDIDADLRADHCSAAEVYYVQAYEKIMGARLNQQRVTVFHRDGEPVLLQKSYSADTALSLKTVETGGMRFPAGTIFAVRNPHESPSDMSRDITSLDITDQPVTVYPRRLAAWTYDGQPLVRACFSLLGRFRQLNHGDVKIHESSYNNISSVNLDLFRDAAHKVLEMCA